MILRFSQDPIGILGFLASHLPPPPPTEKMENSRFLGQDCLGGGGSPTTHRSTAGLGEVNQIPASTINTFTPPASLSWHLCENGVCKAEQKPSYILETGKGRAIGNQLREGAPEGRSASESKKVQAQKRNRWKFSFAVFPVFV